MTIKNFLIYFLFLSATATLIAQNQRTITGIVFDDVTNLPIAGVNLKIKNTGVGVVTNSQGRFSYNLKSQNIENTIFEVTYVGYKSRFITVGSQSNFSIALQEESASLSEVIVTSSYGTKKRKEDLVGSLVNLKGSDLQVQQSAESFDKMLQGLAAGVLVSGGSVQGAPIKIEIRGQGTLTALNGLLNRSSTQPLIIIDGATMSEQGGFDNTLFDGGVLGEQLTNPLTKIAPEDIETLTILKDAAAVGLYGSDAANGVIIITTKKSKAKKLNFSFSTQTGFSSPINQIRYLSGPQFFDIKKEYNLSLGDAPNLAATNAGSSTIDTNWFDLLNRDGSFQRYSFNVATGSKGWNFRTSFNVLLNNEPQISNNFTRFGGNLNVGYSNDKFSIQISASPSVISTNAPNTLFGFPLAPNISPFNPDGSYAPLGFKGFGNPLAVAAQNLNNSKSNGLVGSINSSYAINKNFKISTVFGVDFTQKNQQKYFSGNNESGQFNGTFTALNSLGVLTTYPQNGRRLDTYRDGFRWNQSTQLLYEQKFAKHAIDGLIGLELQREKTDNRRVLGQGFINSGPISDAILAKGSYQDDSYLSENARRSVFSQVNYSYDKRYFFLVNLRRDESSVFGGDVNAALNGGAGAAWNISNEKFFKNSNWIDFLRFRFSYGVTGNSRIGTYAALGLYTNDLAGNDGYNGLPYAYPTSAPNANLSWERNYKSNYAIDLNILNTFKFVLEYYRNDITDLITSRSIPNETGFTTLSINGAEMFNRGFEFSMQADWIKSKKFKWSTNFNISTLENKVTSLKGLGTVFSASERASAQKVGSSTSAIWGIKFAGIDQATGRELFSKNGEIYDAATYRTLFDANDWEVIGDTQPDFFGGIQNNFTFLTDFTLSIRASFRYGDEILIQDDLESKYSVLINRNLSVNALDRWQKPGDIALMPRVDPSNPIFPNSSRFLRDNSHIKIQNINLNYQFPISKIKSKWIKGLGFSVDISNVVYFYREKSLRGRNGVAEYSYLYPEAQTLTFGFQTSF